MSTRLERLLYIDRRVRAPGTIDANQLAAELEVSVRTIHGDLAFLRERFLAPLVYDREVGTYRYTETGFSLPMINLNDGELVALLLGQRLLHHTAADAMGPAYRSALSKIEGRLPETGVSVPIEGIWMGGDQGPPLPPGLFRELLDSVRERNCIDLTYRAASTAETTQRQVEPYGLYLHRDTWYLIAFCRLRQDYRYFHLARIQAWEVGDVTFAPQSDFDMNAFLQRAFSLEQGPQTYQVKVRFWPPAARYIQERIWHREQVMSAGPDGSVDLQFPASGLREVKQWVMGYGADAEVLAPVELRQTVLDEGKALVGRY